MKYSKAGSKLKRYVNGTWKLTIKYPIKNKNTNEIKLIDLNLEIKNSEKINKETTRLTKRIVIKLMSNSFGEKINNKTETITDGNSKKVLILIIINS